MKAVESLMKADKCFVTALIRSLFGLRSMNPNIKLLAAVGGYNEDLIPIWSRMAASSTARQAFANNVLSFLRQYNLNGIGENKTSVSF